MPGTPPDDLLAGLVDAVGSAHVLTDDSVTKGYRTDWTGRWEGRTTAVARPGSTDEVAAVVRACAAAGVGIVPQGGNTGLVGASIPHHGEVVLSLRRLDEIEGADPLARTLAAGAGVTLAAAQKAAESVGLMLGIDLAARESATLGGAVATNAGGLRVVKHGPTRAQLLGIEAVLADGSVLRRLTGLAKDNVGYDLPGLLAGSEGTLGVITNVLMRLVSPPAHVHVALVGVPSLDAAAQVLAGVRRTGLTIEAAEFFHADGLALVRSWLGLRAPFPEGHPTYLLLETSGGTEEEVVDAFADQAGLVGYGTFEPAPGSRLWAYREGHTEAVNAAAVAQGSAPVKLDVALPVRRHEQFETALRASVAERFPDAQVVTFGHLAEGNSHVNVLGVPPAKVEDVTDVVLRLVVDHGGSISAEHGVGQARRPWLSLARSPVDIAAMQAIKRALDPRGVLSPGTLLPPA
ncbi:MAG: FAD-binding oxidoreductase [Jiangellaceae bacterium]